MLVRRSKLVSAMALLATGALVVSACGGGDSGGTGGNTQNQKPADIGAADQVFNRPTVNDSGDFTMVREGAFTDYNNNTGAANNFQNTVVLSLMQPSPYIPDLVNNQVVIKLDGDYMDSVKVLSSDPLVVEWNVKKEAVWSDGEPVDCDDFYLIWLAGASKVTSKGEGGADVSVWDSTFATGHEDITKVECSNNDKTIKTTFSKVFADYRSLFGPMLPAHILERESGVPDITKLTTEDEATNPANAAEVKKAAEFYKTGWVGFKPELALSAGPFKIESANQDEVVLARNDRWWAAKPGPSKITVRVNQDAQSAAQQLQNKEVDIIAVQADAAVAQKLRGDSSVLTFALAGQTYEHIDFQLSKPLFKDHKELRQAVAACVNRQDLIDKLVRDVDPNAKPQGSFMFMYNEQGYVDHYSDTGNGDAEGAKKILTDAGWTLGSDGIMVAPDGMRASFRMGHRVIERRAQTARLIAASCRPAGIEIIDDQTENFNDERLPAGDFDVALFAWVGTAVKSSAYGNYACKSAGGTSNYNTYCDPDMDKKYAEANKELDFNKRIQLLNEVDKIMRDDLHSLPLFVLPDFAASQANVTTSTGSVSYVGAIGGATWNAYSWQRK
jgi:peptide/nickel transport system substrate-binding protein